jgi:hypothetical protein
MTSTKTGHFVPGSSKSQASNDKQITNAKSQTPNKKLAGNLVVRDWG